MKKVGNYFSKIFIILFLCVQMYPIIWLLLSSVKSPSEFSLRAVYALPEKLTFSNYAVAWTVGKMGIYFRNSAIATLVALLLIITFSAPVSFAITKMKWKLSRITLTFFLLGITIPVQVVLIPLFIIYKNVGLLNSLLGLIIVYSAFGLPISIYLFVGFFKSVPNQMIEAAVIDGCSIFSVFTRIMLPLMKNAIATVLTIQFLFTWNDLVFSMTFISKMNLKTVQTGLMYFTGQFGQRYWGPTFASIVMSTLPTLFLYLFLNKVMIKGLTAGAVKG